MNLFPVFLKLEGRPCLVVGGGKVCEGKIGGLIEAGARVQVVAPQATEAVERWAQEGKLRWYARPFESGDLNDTFLVVVATASRQLNDQVFREARQRGILCNVVDDPPRCDFYYPSVVRRGDLQIAISTAGNSPFLAQRLRRELEERFGPEYDEWAERLGRTRRGLFRRDMNPERRRQLLRRLSSAERFDVFRQRRAVRIREGSGVEGVRP